MFPFVEGYQKLKQLVVQVLPLSLELVVLEAQLLLIVAKLVLDRHGDVGGVHEELVMNKEGADEGGLV